MIKTNRLQTFFLDKREKMLKCIDKYRKRNKMEIKFRSIHVFIHNITPKLKNELTDRKGTGNSQCLFICYLV